MLVLGVVPAVLLSLLGHFIMTRAASDAAGQRLEEMATSIADEVDVVFKRLTQGVSDLAVQNLAVRRIVEEANGIYATMDSASAERYVWALSREWQSDSARIGRDLIYNRVSGELKRFRQRNPEMFDRLLVTDSMGIVIGATTLPSRIDLSDQPWWQAAYNRGGGAVYVGNLATEANAYLMNIAIPVLDENQTRTLGVVRVLANVSEIGELVEDVDIGATGFATLLSTYGDILISPIGRPGFAPTITGDRLRRLTTHYPTYFHGRGLAGSVEAVVALAPVPSTRSTSPTNLGGAGWTVSVEQSKTEILAPVHQFGRAAVFILLLSGAAVLVVGLFLSERITRPLRNLRDGAHRIGSGDLDLRLSLRTGDEIEELAADFNTMAEKLQASYRGLEDKIRVATAQLAREKESLQAIVTALGEGLMVVDTDRRIVMWNRAAERITGYDTAEVFGRPCAEILQTGTEEGDATCETGCPVASCLVDRRPVFGHDMSHFIVNREGDRVPVSYTASPLFDEEDRSRGCVVVLRDITREKEMDRLKSSMISTVSHELRAPLTPIIGFAEMLERSDLKPEKRREFLGIIIREARRLSDLVDQFLTLSRIESGKFELHLEATDIRRIVDDIVTIESSQHPEHRLRSEIPRDFPAFRADPDRIKRVMYNLVSNAIKYSPDGGAVTIAARVDDGFVEVSVSDEGIGIRREDLGKLFDRFQRVNRAATPTVTGTGLGLSICRGLVEEHGGTVRVDSEYGKGSTFIVRLPVDGPPEPPPDPTA